jgi:hypothetical protein
MVPGILWAVNLPAQTTSRLPTTTPAPSGSIAGTVTDPTGALIPGATITVRREGLPPVTVACDSTGNFTVSGLAPGVYTVEASANGFRSATRQQVTVTAGHAQTVTLALAIQVQEQQVTVNPDQMDASPDKNADAVVLKGSDLDALSPNPEDLQNELQAIAGSDPDAGTQFYVDGFSGGHLPPKSAIREIRINQNPFSAQYDQIGWGRVEIFTKPGADKWHADLWTEGNDSGFNSSNPFVNAQPPYHSFRMYVDLNGPITKHSSQFTELGQENADDESIVNAYVLNASLAQVPYTQTFPTTSENTYYTTRYDLQAGKIQTLSLRYQLERSEQTNAGVGQFALASQAYHSDNTEQVLQFSDSQVYGVHWLNETRFQYIRDRNSQTPQDLAPTIVVQGGFTGGGSNAGFNHDNQDHYELQNYVQTTQGRHTVDFGVRLRVSRDANDSTANFNGQYTFATLAAYQITEQGIANGWTAAQIAAAGGGPSLFSQTTGTPSIVVNVFDAGLYAEDNYKIRPNVTLSYGFRFETQTGIPDHGDFAPRFGASWAIHRGKNKPPLAVLRGGFGLFYQRFPSLNVLEAERQNGLAEQELVVNDPAFYPLVCSTDPGVCSGAPAVAPTIFRISPMVRSPYVMFASLGGDKPLGKVGSLSVNYQLSRGDHLFLTRNINAPLPGTYDPSDPASGMRPLGMDENIYEYESEGDSVRHRFVINANVHAKSVGLFSNFAISKAMADTSGIGNFPSNGYDLHQDWGRASNDYRSRAFVGGYWSIWRDISVDPFMIYQSSLPFNIVLGQDLNGDTQFNDRPTFATDLSRSSVVRTRWGTFDTEPIAGQTTIPINYGTGPGMFYLNMEAMKSFNFGPSLPQEESPAPTTGSVRASSSAKKRPIERKYTLGLGIASQNVINHVNLAPPVGVLDSPLFGESTALASNFGNGSANRTINADLSFRF